MKRSIKILIIIFLMLSHESKSGRNIVLRDEISGTFAYTSNIQGVGTTKKGEKIWVYLLLEQIKGDIIGIRYLPENGDNKENPPRTEGCVMGRYAKIIQVPNGDGKHQIFFLEEGIWKTSGFEVELDEPQQLKGILPKEDSGDFSRPLSATDSSKILQARSNDVDENTTSTPYNKENARIMPRGSVKSPTITDWAHAKSYKGVRLNMQAKQNISNKKMAFNDDNEVKKHLAKLSCRKFDVAFTFNNKSNEDFHLENATLTSGYLEEISKEILRLRKAPKHQSISQLRPSPKNKEAIRSAFKQRLQAYIEANKVTAEAKS